MGPCRLPLVQAVLGGCVEEAPVVAPLVTAALLIHALRIVEEGLEGLLEQAVL